MDYFGKRSAAIILCTVSALLLAFLAWQYMQGGRAAIQGEFAPVNEQMQQVLEQSAGGNGVNKETAQAASQDHMDELQAAAGGDGAQASAQTSGGINDSTAAEREKVAPAEGADSSHVSPSEKPASVNETNTSRSGKVPSEAATTQAPSVDSAAGQSSAGSPSDKLDLNTATLEQLDELPGIGESKAKAILEYRKEKGAFHRVEELTEVKGIGEKMLEKLKPLVYVTAS